MGAKRTTVSQTQVRKQKSPNQEFLITDHHHTIRKGSSTSVELDPPSRRTTRMRFNRITTDPIPTPTELISRIGHEVVIHSPFTFAYFVLFIGYGTAEELLRKSEISDTFFSAKMSLKLAS
jgi:hypothetical protein